ncbi:PUMP5 [Symbiodinium pilosum]|uniref:PUMP5 protein n=1 Tax=Symbiodinium pilosum TaxID=2952 RepID=A0A812KV43_SYMPI|nr:PUMP5 [Symbiodinium pilosum]
MHFMLAAFKSTSAYRVIRKLTHASSRIRRELSVKAVENLLDRLELNVPGELSFRQEASTIRWLKYEQQCGAKMFSVAAQQDDRAAGKLGFVQGSVGAAIGGSCAHPLDLIKATGGTRRNWSMTMTLSISSISTINKSHS